MSIDPWKVAFWQVVTDCLVAFHDRKADVARTEVLLLRAGLENAPADIDPEIVYHAEAFDVAARLAGAKRDVDLSKYRDRYEKIWRKRLAGISEETITVARPRIHPREARA